MRSNLGRFRRTTSRSLVEQLATLTSVGDGSTLSLDFTTGVLDPRLTFTRTTNATFINSSGLVEWAGANAMTQSNDFSVSPWAVSNVSVSIDGTSPVGNAWKILENSANDVHRLNPGGISSGIPGTGVPVSISIHVKQGSGSRQAYMLISDNGTGDVRSKRLDPVTGTLVGTESSGGSWSNASTSVQNLGNGWYRLTLTATRGGGSALICRTGLSDSSGNLTYQGDGTSFLYFSGHQINPGSTAQQYYATTGSAYHAPRFDYDPTTIGSPRGLLIEGSANNLTKYSEDLSQVSISNYWYGANFNTPSVPGGAPNSPYGTTAASWKLIATAGTGFHMWRNVVAFTAADYTFSFWAKAAEYDRVVLSDPGTGRGACTFVLTGNGTATVIAGTVTPTNPQIVKFDNGWYRCSVTMTMTAANYGIGVGGYPSATTPTQFGASYNADGTSGVYVTMFQTELGSGASSYIPTGSSQGSRVAESLTCTGANFSSWYQNATESSVLVESIVDQDATGFRRVFALTSSSNTTTGFPNWSGIVAGASSSRPSINANITANNQVDAYLALAAAVSNGQIFRLAFAAKAGDYRVSRVVSGTTYASTSTYNGYPANIGVAAGSGLYFVSDGAYFRALWLRAFKFYPFRITNAQMDSWAI